MGLLCANHLNQERRRPMPLGWYRVAILFVAALLGCTPLAGTAQAPSQSLRDIDLPAQALEASLKQLSERQKVQVIFLTEDVRGLRAPAVKGRFTLAEAVERLVGGSGLTASFNGPDTVVIKPRPGGKIEGGRQTSSATIADTASPPGATLQTAPLRSAESIVVTGTHIRGISPASPLTVITREEIERAGFASTQQLLQSLPQNFTGGDGMAFIAGASTSSPALPRFGGTTPSLHGLGDATLVLVDGRRLPRSGTRNASDASLIPLNAIERVEIVSDGSSAVYGADAIAGVVNFILRKNYEGAEVSALSGISSRGGGDQVKADAVAGTDWGSGNAIVAYTWQQQDPLFARERPVSSTAEDPTSLIAQSRSHQLSLAARQDLTNRLSLFATGLYLEGNERAHETFFAQDLGTDVRFRQFSADAGADVALPGDWTGRFAVAAGSSYSLSTPFAESLALGSAITENRNRMNIVDLRISGPLRMVPWDGLKAALGAGYERDDYRNILTNPAQAQPIQSTVGKRNIRYAYAEVYSPLIAQDKNRIGLQSLDLSGSIRADSYSDVESSVTSKIGLVYRPASDFAIKATKGSSFRAPTLNNLLQVQNGQIRNLADAQSASQRTITLTVSGGNRDLKPEKSKSWTASIDWTPSAVRGLAVSTTYYDFRFTDRIAAPATSILTFLNDPALPSFIIRNPTPQQVQAVASGLSLVTNLAGAAGGLANVRAIAFNNLTNIAVWTARGIDASVSYDVSLGTGSLKTFASGSLLDRQQKTTPPSAAVTLSGIALNPLRVKARAGVSWVGGPWSISTYANYISAEKETTAPGALRLPSFTTQDLQVNYAFRGSRLPILSNSVLRLGVTNLFDRMPPSLSAAATTFIPIGFDIANTSAVGRYITLQVSKAW